MFYADNKGTGRLSSASGVAMVELAICLPFLIALLFGMFEFGLYFQERAAMEQAAQAGSLAVALHEPPELDAMRVKERYKAGIDLAYLTMEQNGFNASNYDYQAIAVKIDVPLLGLNY